ncbi:phosphotransferase [Ornithinimicrobium sp. W1665]|uniref:phosphotransferase family protein n=1 Tax=Ornithinimicrobium sp. W1665 TaxID=3416666 RepID=UPI003D6A2F52
MRLSTCSPVLLLPARRSRPSWSSPGRRPEPVSGCRRVVPVATGSSWWHCRRGAGCVCTTGWTCGGASRPSTRTRSRVLLARLHTVAPAVRHEPDGAPPQGWYEAPPGAAGWDRLAAEAVGAGTSWSSRLAAATASISALSAALGPADPDRLRLCHRDLHPENVLTDGSGELVVVDWDDVGPADPTRELAGALVLCFHDGTPDLDAMRRAYAAYVEAGGPGRLRTRADFSMLLSTRFNFLHAQARVALDPTATPRERAWAEEEVDEGLRTLPTPELLDAVLDAVGRTSPVEPGGMPFSVS